MSIHNAQAPSPMRCLPEIGSDELEPFVYCKPEGVLMDLLDQLEAAEDSQVSFTSPELNKPREPWPAMACVWLVKPMAAWVFKKERKNGERTSGVREG